MRSSTVETHNVIYLVPVRSSRSVRLSNLKLAGRAAYRVGPRGTTMRLSVERLCAARYGMKNRLRGRLIWRRQWAQDVTGQKTYGLRRQPTADSAAAAAADYLATVAMRSHIMDAVIYIIRQPVAESARFYAAILSDNLS